MLLRPVSARPHRPAFHFHESPALNPTSGSLRSYHRCGGGNRLHLSCPRLCVSCLNRLLIFCCVAALENLNPIPACLKTNPAVTANHGLPLIKPRVTPVLDAEFRPAVLATHAFVAAAKATGNALPVRLALEQTDGSIYHFN